MSDTTPDANAPEPTLLQKQAKLSKLVKQELPIQTASVDMEGGSMPSCMTLFDRYLACICMCFTKSTTLWTRADRDEHRHVKALRNQITSFYRYGYPASGCDIKWDDFKFCLAVRTDPPEQRRQLWVERRAQWWAARRMSEPNSEDIWDAKEYPADAADRFSWKRPQT